MSTNWYCKQLPIGPLLVDRIHTRISSSNLRNPSVRFPWCLSSIFMILNARDAFEVRLGRCSEGIFPQTLLSRSNCRKTLSVEHSTHHCNDDMAGFDCQRKTTNTKMWEIVMFFKLLRTYFQTGSYSLTARSSACTQRCNRQVHPTSPNIIQGGFGHSRLQHFNRLHILPDIDLFLSRMKHATSA